MRPGGGSRVAVETRPREEPLGAANALQARLPGDWLTVLRALAGCPNRNNSDFNLNSPLQNV